MKIAIHHTPGTFSDKWIEYCKLNNVSYKLVNGCDSNIIEQIHDCNGFMWHWMHDSRQAMLFAKSLSFSLERGNVKMFPDSNTCWHFDDKLAQKYLLESVGASLVPTHVFYNRSEALRWAAQTDYPKVFKLRGGAGSLNVSLVNNQERAIELISIAFGKGFSPIPALHNDLKTKLKKIKSFRQFWNKLTKMNKLIKETQTDKHFFSNEKGYAYFQDFIPNNDHDIRVIIIGDRAFAIKRMVRENDFRASGSGSIIHDSAQIPLECVSYSFELAGKLKMQSLAIDYVFHNNKPIVVEISYGFSSKGYLNCPGYWDSKLNWYPGSFVPEWFMISDFIKSLN